MLIPDDERVLKQQLIRLCDQRQLDLILTTGGTGCSPRDITPEATLAVADKNVPGIAEAMRAASMKITPHAMISRAASVIRGKTLIINLPGSPKACMENMDVFMDTIPPRNGASEKRSPRLNRKAKRFSVIPPTSEINLETHKKRRQNAPLCRKTNCIGGITIKSKPPVEPVV